MTKLKTPLLSLGAVGRLAKTLAFRAWKHQTIAEKLPIPTDRKSPAQLSWRTMFEACTALWHTLTAEEKAIWERLARPKHMTGYALWQSQCLRPNPGIYLPLVGGTMQGNIDMASHKIFTLPDPTDPQDADTKAARDTAISAEATARTTADALRLLLAGGTMSGAIAMGTNKITGMGDPTANQDAVTKKYFEDNLPTAGLNYTQLAGGQSQAAPTGSGVWTDWDISTFVPAATKYVEILIKGAPNNNIMLGARKNGTTLNRSWYLNCGQTSYPNSWMFLCEVDANRVLEIMAWEAATTTWNIIGYWS